MDTNMFCFQCQQTAGCSGCVGNTGVCGKSSVNAGLQDKLTGALIGLGRVARDNPLSNKNTAKIVLEGLFATVTNVNFDDDFINKLIDNTYKECERLNKPMDEYDLELVWEENEDIRSLKSLILFGIRGMGAYAYHAMVLGYTDDELDNFFYKALATVGADLSIEELLPVVMETGKYNLTCMELLDRANTETYGTPEPTSVSLKVEKGPFIVVTGHDLRDLKLLLEQTEGKGINIYTNGEMLPAHAYPKLKAYSHLKGNIGTAWHKQQSEFDNLPAPVLFTSNCIMPPRDSYIDNIYTTEVVAFPNVKYIDENKDFTPIIEKALALGGYDKDIEFKGNNGGGEVLTGFGHGAILSSADKIVEAVKSGAVKHFFLVGGCDGAGNKRNYYKEFAESIPKDCIILTLACGKFRFNDIDFGKIGDFPRLMDMGQCNDAYGAIKVAIGLAEAFNCGVNDLPLSMILSWYEQKAVCILLTLLYLGIKDIRLGPTLPAFLSPNILSYLVENFNIMATGDAKEDLEAILA